MSVAAAIRIEQPAELGAQIIAACFAANDYHLDINGALDVPRGFELSAPWNLPSRLFQFPIGLVTVLCRSPERLELATGDRRDDQAHRRVQAGGGAYCADQRAIPRQGCIGFGGREVDAGQMGVTVSAQ